MNRMDFLFGYKDQKIYSKWNYYALHVKYFIWLTRCLGNNLSVEGFFSWFLFEIKLDQGHNNEELYFLDELAFSLS
jgi:nucleoside-specific outer membrane channel protein Tsx